MPSKGPTLRGVVDSLTSLVRPDDFVAADPTIRGVRYREGRTRGIQPLADVYLPPPPLVGPRGQQTPSVVLVHGGGFLIGDRHMKPMRVLATEIVQLGFAVCSVDYRMLFRGGTIADAVEDVRAAVSWWLAQDRFPILEGRTSVIGLSAGSTLAHHAAAAHAASLQQLISFFGVYDFEALGGGLGKILHTFLFDERAPAAWSPSHLAGDLRLPLTYLHGTADQVVPYAQAETMMRALERAHHPSFRLHSYPGLPHGFLNQSRDAQVQTSLEVVRSSLLEPPPYAIASDP